MSVVLCLPAHLRVSRSVPWPAPHGNASVGKHVCSREGVLGSNSTTPKWLPKVFVARWRLLRNAPSKGRHSRYLTLFFKGTYSVIGFYELMRMFLVG